jgi:hypothetical protein
MIAGASASLLSPPMAMLPAMLEHDRKRDGWSVGQARRGDTHQRDGGR